MRVEPDDCSVGADQGALVRTVRSRLEHAATTPLLRQALDRALPARAPGEAPPPLYPGLMTAAHRVRSVPGPVAEGANGREDRIPPGFDAELSAVLERADASTRRAHPPLAGTWQLDLPPAEPHLAESVRRALAQIPCRTDITPSADVVGWRDTERAVAAEAAEAIRRVWPGMFAELATVVRQLALLAGPSINGFTDFATHGAIYLNRSRLAVGRDGLPGYVRLAEALVHEATHSRCNAASVSTRFLAEDGAGENLVNTPLRADPRPLSGLFQQIVVIARSVRLYDLVLDRVADRRAGDGAALSSRRNTLCEQGVRGLRTARAHADALSEAGLAVLDEADVLLCHA
jgi:hypothetical protein